MSESNNYSNESITKRTRISKCSLVIILVLALIINDHTRYATAEDSAAGGLDMGALASLASNLGSNPQLMSMVTSFLNPDKGGQAQSTASGGASASSDTNSAQGDAISSPVQEAQATPNQASLASKLVSTSRGASKQQDQSATAASASASSRSSGQAQPSNSLSSIVSILPSVLPNLNLASLGNLGGLSSLLGGIVNKPQATAATETSTSSAAVAQPAPPQPATSSPVPVPVQAPPVAPVAAAASATSTAPQPPGAAQTVINQVLTAYAAGQIPSELIQLSLSGRVPPQLIELALSGQVPPQMIQMIITGQVPMSTINTFLNTFQQANEQANKASKGPSYSAEGNVVGGQSAPISGASASTATSSTSSSPGVWSTTRTLFEALFGVRRDNNGKASISVPTLIGPIPVKVPSIGSNVRNFGHLVGGTISNMASMIPF